ncbi:D-alanyl-D-alanine carboxypeptidase [Evansella sp. LMS18]|uniref:D-alanyl-D-alanine carboxypeptidase family protein n=1 Tax=Evansella sp. LMS18 TaxID=2924033 RepID=UPI0020D16795|nr:D-alanyl-D-alanine carboxypeptidase family protein [Evansella sp. LMS18]UTR12398.1 D-alanyl-D-alanine carboxypeptidase [Evansella sp. LMS18]
MIKRMGIFSLLVVFSFMSVFSVGSHAEASFEPNADTAILVDADTGKILYEKNVDQPLPPASMTKMMSEYLILEAVHNGEISWDQTVPISDYLAEMSHNQGLSNVMLRTDRDYTVKELYESVAIYSANASTMALAELIAGSTGQFVERMNEKGKELGLGKLLREEGEQYGIDNLEEIAAEDLGDFQFVNSTGLPNSLLNGNHPEGTNADDDNYMSARAAATLAFHLVNDFPEVLDTASIPEKVFQEGTSDAINMQNWNWMLEGTMYGDLDYAPVDGLKTGFTNAAGYCFTGTAEKDGQRLITVVMKADSEHERFTETERLMEYGFNSFSNQEILSANSQIEGYETIEVVKGKEDEVSVSTADSVSSVLPDGGEEEYSYTVELDGELLDEEGRLEAPIEEGQVIGTVSVEYTGGERYLQGDGADQRTVDLVANENVERAGWFALMMRGVGGFFSGIWITVADTVRGWF